MARATYRYYIWLEDDEQRADPRAIEAALRAAGLECEFDTVEDY